MPGRMQGSFAGAVAWASALDPGPDEEAQAAQRSDALEREVQRITRLRDPNLPAPVPPQQDPLLYAHVYAPTPHFKLDNMTFYILKGENYHTQARAGRFGHYLVTTVDIIIQPGLCRPINVRRALPPAQRTTLPNVDYENPPGYAPDDPRLKPSPEYCTPLVDYIVPNVFAPDNYYEIGLAVLKSSLEKAEALDLAFARRMEGLGYVSAQVCWDCVDPDYDPSDRPAVMDQFMAKYLGRFYDGVDPHGGPLTEQVVDEAVRKHKAFCQAWARKHYKTLTPTVTAPAEALASEFFPYIETWVPESVKLTRTEFARVLMRLPDLSADFASCLHFYATSLEQARGGRNASYKQMSVVSTYRALSHKRFGDLLAAKASILRETFARLGTTMHARLFDPAIVDWHTILGQMPVVHRLFQNTSVNQGLLRRVATNHGAAHVPPWRTMRNT